MKNIMGIYPQAVTRKQQTVARCIAGTDGHIETIPLEVGTADILVTHIDYHGRDHGYWHQIQDNDSYKIVHVAESLSIDGLWIVCGKA